MHSNKIFILSANLKMKTVYIWFSSDVTAAMLVHDNREKKSFVNVTIILNAKHEP